MKFHPYLNFDGDCGEALRFYAELFGGTLEIIKAADAPVPEQMASEWGDRVLHGAVKVGDQLLMASDVPPGADYKAPASTYVTLSFESIDDARRVFDGLAEGGRIEMPFEETFWSPGFGSLADRFGTLWMVDTTPQQHGAHATAGEATAG